ncbi:MAG: polysulfide reductase NrfD [Deltaproteobacteria bacterium]|nr:polysulfide reductase NrfD [Deltaproteobacteria bacterium]
MLFGLWGVYDRLAHGHLNANYGSYVVWGLWVAAYLFFAGTAAGAYMISSLDLLFKVRAFRNTGKLSLWIALVSLAAAMISILFDLGHMGRAWRAVFQANPGSVMAQMVWGYNLFGLLILCTLWCAIFRPETRLLKILCVLGLFLSLFVSGAVGALLGVNVSRMFWHVGLLPAQFPVFSLGSGAAAMLAVQGLLGDRKNPSLQQLIHILGIMTIVIALVKLFFLWADFSQSYYGNIPQNIDAVNLVLFGPYWWAFWILQILLGTLVPIAFLAQPRSAEKGYWAGVVGILVLLGYGVARANIIFPAMAVPELDALKSAFVSNRLSYDYFPSLMEWAVSIGITGFAVMAFLVGRDTLKLEESRTS